jgi:hypothetical protein
MNQLRSSPSCGDLDLETVETTREDSYRSTVERGYQRAGGYRVCVCGIVRDCAPALQRTLPWVDHLCAQFKDAQVAIFENDSKDHTKAVLSSWAVGRENIHVFLEDYGPGETSRTKLGTVNPSFSYSRIERIARHRNRYLEFASQLSGLDYLIVVDLDVDWIDPNAVGHAFGQEIPWDAQFANGRTWQVDTSDLYRDTYAVWEIGDPGPQTESKIAFYRRGLKPLTKGMPLFAVQSGFGGLGVYRWEAIKGLRYGVGLNSDPRVEVICEHAFLHRQMIAAGNSRLFINPSMILHCDEQPRSRVSLPAMRLANSLRRHGIVETTRKMIRKVTKKKPINAGSEVVPVRQTD